MGYFFLIAMLVIVIIIGAIQRCRRRTRRCQRIFFFGENIACVIVRVLICSAECGVILTHELTEVIVYVAVSLPSLVVIFVTLPA